MRVNQFWFPATTWACTWTPAARYCPPGISLRIASASSSVSVVDVPEPPRTPPWEALPALTVIMFVPAPLIWSSIMDVAPLPIATSVITAETPIIMPSIVRPVRILLRPSALNAMRNVMTGDIVVSLSAAAASAAPAATPSAAASWRAESAAAEAAAAGLSEREIGGSRARFVGQGDVRDDVGALLQIALDELSILSVGNPEPQANRLQLLVDISPRAPRRFNAGKRTKQRVDCRRAALPGCVGSFGRRRWRCATATLCASIVGRVWRATAPALRTASTRIESGVAQPLEPLLTLFRRHVLKSRRSIAARTVVAAWAAASAQSATTSA